MKKAITAAALSTALLVGGASVITGLHKDAVVMVDGQQVSGGGFALTVADLLASRGISLNPGDEVSPALDAPVRDGDTVTVRYTKPVTLDVDGSTRKFFTTATTLSAALSSAALASELDGAELSVLPTAPVPRDGLEVTVSTPKQIKLTVGGESDTITTTALTVAELLTEKGISLDSDDRVNLDHDQRLDDGDVVKVDRVETSTTTKTEPVAFGTQTKKDSSLWKGESRVISAGKPGKAKRTYTITVVNGKVTKKSVTAEDVITEPVDQVVSEGTKTSSNGVGINLARAAMWDKIARCESGGNWKINTGNGYYGGLQFNLASWRSNGGRDFAAYPHQASRAEQITVANRYYAKAGTRPWSCA